MLLWKIREVEDMFGTIFVVYSVKSEEEYQYYEYNTAIRACAKLNA